MKIKYLILATFLITSDEGVRIITDPYKTGDDLTCEEVKESAEIVTISHEHADHNNVAAVWGNPQVFRETGEAKGITFRGIRMFHDSSGGTWLGSNTVFCFDVDGISICHCGDLGHLFNDQQKAAVGHVDILLVPVGGHSDLDDKQATQLCEQLKPKIVIPMHYKNPNIHFPFEMLSVNEFLRGKNNITQLDVSEIEFTKGTLPVNTQIIVLKPSK